jgi:hypothetical protein
MTRSKVLDILGSHAAEIREFGVRTLSIFGSVARDEAAEASDVDLLVEFDKPVGLFAFVRLRRYLEEILGVRVDLVTPDALREQLRERVLKEAVRAA